MLLFIPNFGIQEDVFIRLRALIVFLQIIGWKWFLNISTIIEIKT